MIIMTLWKHEVQEFDSIDELQRFLYNELNPLVKKNEAEVKKIFRSPDKVYFVWWISST